MRLLVFTTKKQLRNYAAAHCDTLLPKLLTIQEFLDRAILTDKVFIPKELRLHYFYKACKNVPLEKLGIEKNFERFVHEADLIYSFLKEVYLENVDLKKIAQYDIYASYPEHIAIIQAIYDNYKKLLNAQGLVDLITLEDFTINNAYFDQFEAITIYLSGYLSRFDKEIIRSIRTPVTIELEVTPFNKTLADKMFGIQKQGLYTIDQKGNIQTIQEDRGEPTLEVCGFSKRVEQANFVFAKIEEFVRSGIDPQNIAVILPQKDFKEYLEAFDRLDNLNFSMGDSFIYSALYRKLEALYRYCYLEEEKYGTKLNEEEIETFQKIDSWQKLETFIQTTASDREKRVIEESLYLFGRLIENIEINTKDMVKLLLERLKELSFDDIRGGKVTVMEMLESRGCQYDGVIIVDFNEEVVPKIGTEDLFLDSSLRKSVGLPTMRDKESLQKHYYYQLMQHAKRVALGFVKNEERDVSRFFYELPFQKQQENAKRYENVLYTKTQKAGVFEINTTFELPKVLTPTTLEILLRCPLRYYLRSIEQITVPKERVLGFDIHESINRAILAKPKSAQDYFEKIIKNVIQTVSRYDEYRLRVEWEEKLRKFAQRDFALLNGEVLVEKNHGRAFGDYIIEARADRVVKRGDKVFIYDYKTSKTGSYLKTYEKDEAKLQAEFYAYIWQTDEVYFWDLHNVELEYVDTSQAKEQIERAIDSLEGVTKKCEDTEYCKYCPYKFGCKGLV
ncbi:MULTISPECIES: PD-(D/E)XK nuclease family protein [unclassified Nitratiruptor]|uniref:RecB family exonuclease n=1 Tax=unclassified Nitratiruptor TaxID=2624044 RepID=UPI0019157F09|nr:MULTISPECIES: PD-(D/E)XK nuclease family protein [unclassified Nitratiruptor]BCD59696.1 hypothetical protein NitYY0810_C0448 [Nitratiruptor sp. YY08-10]BCD63620.1 hypothetical protein NitYY0814_C0448 [Nitratiruptor sp. YY08-14]